MRYEDSQVTTDWLASEWGEKLWTDSQKKNRLIQAYNEEKASARSPTTAEDIPFRYEDITNEWLTACIAGEGSDAHVVNFTLGPKDDGTSNRRHIKMEWDEAGKKAGQPTSVFCKATQDLLNRITLSYGALESETNFYKELRSLVDMEAPEAVHANMNAKTYNSIIMLKDLSGQVKFLNCFSLPTKDEVKDQLLTLAKLHGQFYNKKDPIMDKFVHFATGLRGHIASGGVEGANESGWKEAEKVINPSLFKRWNEVWPACLISLNRNHDLPQTMVHSDVHRGNWYQRNDGKMGLQDFQCFSRGPWYRDVAYLLATCTNVETRREWEDELLAYYLEQLHKAGGPKVDEREARLEICLQLFTVAVFWLHTLTPSSEMPEMQPYDIAYENVKRIATIMHDWDALGAAHHFAPRYNVPLPDPPANGS